MYQKEFSIWYREMTHQLLEIFTKEKEGENIVFSPFSILSMLSILADASAGKTREQILQALNGWMPLKGIPDIFSGDPIPIICDTNQINAAPRNLNTDH